MSKARDYLKNQFENSFVSDVLRFDGAEEWADELMNEIERLMRLDNEEGAEPAYEEVLQPTVGRIVHCYYDGETRAAIITEVPELLSEQPNSGPEGYIKAVHLKVFLPYGEVNLRDVRYSKYREQRTWSWPSRS